MIWTQEKKDKALELWQSGYTGSEIAKSLAEIYGEPYTRSMIMGMARRNNFPRRLGVKTEKIYRPPPKIRINREEKTLIAAKSFGTPCHSLDLTKDTCRCVIGEPKDLMHCGAPVYGNSVYCKDHHAIFYTGKFNYQKF